MPAPTQPPDPAEAPRWQRRPTERRREILDAAMAVFGEEGFDCATVAGVAERAGVSAGTVAHYFGSKADLFVEVIRDQFLEPMAESERLVAEHKASYRSLLQTLLRLQWARLTAPGTPDLLLVGLAKAQTFPDAGRTVCRAIGERFRQLIRGVLEAGIEGGEFRPVNAELVARVLSSGLAGLMMAHHQSAAFDPGAPSAASVLEQHLELIDRALAVDESRSDSRFKP
ncbi:MAG TPA: TetR/AcrR family transcriptional regulator [Gemmatimonadales bacterium]|nr:TetR/AcrR family transcriptional regulator [Gemmatimonadales bacterium]